jgi:hypothetical protein
MTSCNPLENFHVSTFLQSKKEEAIEKHKESVILEARYIHELLKKADVSVGYVHIPRKRVILCRENLTHLSNNGFRALAVSLISRDFLSF